MSKMTSILNSLAFSDYLELSARMVLAAPALSALYLIAGFFAYKLCQTLYTGFMGGNLRSMPGPFLTRFTHWPLRWATIRGKQVFFIDALHHKYGQYVRICPDQVSISDMQSVKEIHKIGTGFLKTKFYQQLTHEAPDCLTSFTLRDPKQHSQRRKLLASPMSKNGLLQWEDLIHEKVNMAIEGIKRTANVEGKADILAWFTFLTHDVISTLAFGDSFKSLETGAKTQYILDLEVTLKQDSVSIELPWLAPILDLVGRRHRLEAAGSEAYERTIDLEKKGYHRGTLFSKMLVEDGQALTARQIKTEAVLFLVAGSDTTAVSLTYLLFEVLSNPSVRERVMEEVNSLPDEFTTQDAMDLPYLTRVRQEVLRLHTAAPASLPRTVPKGGRMLGGYFFDDSVIVSSQSYTLHRDPIAFPDPLKFDPDRWLEPTQAMRDAFMPFGAGSRVCLGIHLASMEIMLTTAMFLRAMPGVKLARETNRKAMEPENFFLIQPKAHACYVEL